MNKKTIKDIDIQGKKVLVRCDFNVPLDENGNIASNQRIVATLPTIKYLIEKNCKIILCSHLGRPKGTVKPEFSLKPVAKELSRLLNIPVIFANDIIGEDAKQKALALKSGEVMLLENVRFDSREELNDLEFAKQLASLAELYINDAFGTAHRANASTEGVAHHLPAVAGFLMEKEINFLGSALENPKKPFIAILGGAKVSDKIGVIENLLTKVDSLLIGGAMANTFLKAQGYNVGKSLVENDKLDLAKEILEKAKKIGVKIILPNDVMIAQSPDEKAESKIVNIDEVSEQWAIYDIGPDTVVQFENELRNAKTIVWNGPLGLFEIEQFASGTNSIARIITSIDDIVTIIGGGDSVSAVKKTGLANKITHISTGGGASLELLEGKKLPGIECLN